ncbi:hypothetical protein AB4234_03825 [Vibrio cyclitrophicus]
MQEDDITRIKTSMLIFSLEKALGNFVLDKEHLGDQLSTGAVENIIERSEKKGAALEKEQVALILQASYLGEVFDFALNVAKGTICEEYLVSLKALANQLGIFDIRNAVCHPNNPFPDCYWYRAATIASDPLIEKLGLQNVSEALTSAVAGQLNEPPQSWFSDVKWAIPNNLPKMFPHEITGLLGRETEFKELNRLLLLPRESLITIVAPGGIGKTALVLQLLKDLSLTPSFSKQVDRIIFCSLKNEELTADGLRKIDAVKDIESIKSHIFNELRDLYPERTFGSFEEACVELNDEKILLCIDNLETLLIESQHEFQQFNQELPLRWKVLVTSRVSLGAGTSVPLEPLKQKHSVALARNYFRKRGVMNIQQRTLQDIAKAANHNPLAIRLTVDLYLKGNDIPESIQRSQKDIASFSYKNLIDAIDDTAVSILEAIFAQQVSNRTELSQLLDLSYETVVEAVNELTKTTLITRESTSEDFDSYKLADSIRELLIFNPRNIDVRKKVSEEIRKRKVVVQELNNRQKQLEIDKYSDEYIAPETADLLTILVNDTNKELKNGTNSLELRMLKDRYNDLSKQFRTDEAFCFNYSRILQQLGDIDGAKACILSKSPRCRLQLAWVYFNDNDFESSATKYGELYAEGFGDNAKSNSKFAYRINRYYLTSLLYSQQTDDVINITNDWESHQQYRDLFGSMRASAYKRSVEHKVNQDARSSEVALNEAISTLERLFELERYSYTNSVEAYRVMKEIRYILSRPNMYSSDFVKCSLQFIANHLFDVCQSVKVPEKEQVKIIQDLRRVDVNDNPINSMPWLPRKEPEQDNSELQAYERQGYTIVKVTNIPDNVEGVSPFIFAKDRKGITYYLNVKFLVSGSWLEWATYELGDKFGIKFGKSNNNGNTYPATEIIEL